MKKSKLSLEDFKVQSFVTSVDQEKEKTFKGGVCTQQATLPCTICFPTGSPPGCYETVDLTICSDCC